MRNGLYSIEEVSSMINGNMKLILAGDEGLLDNLPPGEWIAGTIPYFMSDEGGVFTKEKIYVNSIPEYAEEIKIKEYDTDSLSGIASDEFENGYTLLIIPGFSEIHSSFSRNSNTYKHIFNKPILGWVSGVELGSIGKVSPKVYCGTRGSKTNIHAVAMHVKLPANKIANLDMINLYRQGKGPGIKFPETGFVVNECIIDGQPGNLAEYIEENDIDVRVPLVADYYGAMINTSFNYIDMKKKEVGLFAPVFADVEYKIAVPVGDYVSEFNKKISGLNIQPVFTCNCLLNYIHLGLEGKKTSNLKGPITFGEIAYQLLNQTLIYLTVSDV